MLLSQKRENQIKHFLSSRKTHILIILLAGILLYWNTLDNQMFWDDDDFILNNVYIKSWKYLPNYFSENIIAGSGFVSDYWRPFLMLIFSIQWSLWQDWAVGYHLTNLLFHTFSGVLLYQLVNSLFSKPRISLLVSIIFIIHPVQTEAVAYANSLGDSQSVSLLLLSLINLLRYLKQETKSSKIWVKSLIYYTLALLSKETAIVGVLLALLVYIKEKKPRLINTDSLIKTLKVCWGYLGVSVVYIILRATVFNFKNTFNLYDEKNEFTTNILVRILTFFKIFLEYISLIFYPHNLHMERSLPLAKSLFEPNVFLGFLLFITFICLGIWAFKEGRVLIWFGLSWFFICLIPTSNILIPINGLLYEHWLYNPIIGFSIFVYGGVILILDRNKSIKILKPLLITAGLIYLIFFSYKTVQRNDEWENPISFYEQTLKHSPKNYRLLNNLGMEYAEIGEMDKAIVLYLEAIELLPDNAVAYHNLGNAYKVKGYNNLAEENFKKALELDENFIFSKRALVKIYFEVGDLLSLEHLLLNERPGVEDYFLMYQFAYELEEYKKAFEYLENAEKLEPNNIQILNKKREVLNLISP